MKKSLVFLLLLVSFKSVSSVYYYPDHKLSNVQFSWAKAAGERKACYDGWLSSSVGKSFKETFDQGWSYIDKNDHEAAIDFLNVVTYFAATGDSSKSCLK